MRAGDNNVVRPSQDGGTINRLGSGLFWKARLSWIRRCHQRQLTRRGVAGLLGIQFFFKSE
jgi:hypothetical protein